MGKASKVTVGYKYYMGLHMSICRGPVDELCEITVGDRQAWQGSVTGNTQFSINKKNLFGGTKAEGGIDGTLDVMMGGATQTMSSKLRAMLQGDQPEFRGLMTTFFDGMVCAMSPYPKAWKFRVRRILSGWDGPVWYPQKATINLTGYYDDGSSRQIKAMNPVHIIYEALTNRAWGLGRDRSLFLDDAWRKAADDIYDEGFGLCIRWGRQDTLMSFVQTIIDHIGCAVYVDKFTGKFKIKLIRNDYDADSLPIVDMDSGLLSIDEATNASTYNLINEVIVNAHNPVTNKDFQARQHNLALIQTQGALNSDTRDYPGIPTPELAIRIAQRDLKAASTNVRRFTVTADRRLWRLQPGDVFKLRDPQSRGIETVVVRVGKVEETNQTDGSIKITAVQDVFGVELNTFADVQPPSHVEPTFDPQLARRLVYEYTYAELARLLPTGEFEAIKPAEGFVHAHAEKPTAMSAGADLAVRPEGQANFVVNGTTDFTPLAELQNQIGYLDTQLQYYREIDFDDDEEVYVGMSLLIGDGQKNEIVRLDALDRTTKTMTIARGCWDTIPQRHFGGALIWAIEDNGGTDATKYLSGETVDVKILPFTLRGGSYPIDEAPIDSVLMRHRFFRPYAPGLVEVETIARGSKAPWYVSFDLRADVGSNEVPDFALITWAHRDRPVQQDKLIDHMQTSIGPEPGTTYRLRVFNATGALVRTETGITGTQFAYTYQMAADDTQVELEATESTFGTIFLDAQRDGVDSWMYYTLTFTVHKKPPQNGEVALLSMQTTADDTDMTSNPDNDLSGAQVSSMQMNATQDDSDIATGDDNTGGQVALMSENATQTTKILPTIDFYLYEAPYLTLAREGRDLTHSQMLGFVARPSDRATDGYDFCDRLQGEEAWHNNGAAPWTPWGVLKGFMAQLTNEFEVDLTSDTDGVPIGSVQQGDVLLIDNELMVVQSVDGKRFTVGRGAVDTVPAIHYAKVVVWLFDRAHAAADRLYGDNDVANAVIRPHSFAEAIRPEDMPFKQLQMQYRPIRPYPPGMLLFNGQHWFKRINALADENYEKPQGKPVIVTWAHRNRIWQDDEAYDHYATGIPPEPGVEYRIWIGYRYIENRQEVKVTLDTLVTSDAGITFTKEMVERWGEKAGRFLQSPGFVGVEVAVNAVRDGVFNWQGYGAQMLLPSYPLSPGEKPGGGTVPPDPEYPQPGDPTPNPNDPDPNPNPGDGNGDTDPLPDPGNPDPNPDPEVPDTDPPAPEPEPEPDPENVFGWSNNWDHGWASKLPDQNGE
ncbi:hypothetical protein [Cronobacter phage JC01]|uniref:Tip attachment protein J domain-containing protein n=1 Tax=Cronobacter phage JC01 TaxID=2729575 RepID=A0A6M3YQX0_9CAUD|nr:tail protein [Cronobacter phage JC01]QJI52247.1 hypothetical protein [Cronobacter phage JC01]